jgi:hypothetical protein
MDVSKDSFLAFANGKIRMKKVFVGGYGDVFIRVLKARDRDNYEGAIAGGDKFNFDNFRSKLVALCFCDEKGNRIFSDSEVPLIGELPADLVNLLFTAAQELNGFTAKAAEQAEKN